MAYKLSAPLQSSSSFPSMFLTITDIRFLELLNSNKVINFQTPILGHYYLLASFINSHPWALLSSCFFYLLLSLLKDSFLPFQLLHRSMPQPWKLYDCSIVIQTYAMCHTPIHTKRHKKTTKRWQIALSLIQQKLWNKKVPHLEAYDFYTSFISDMPQSLGMLNLSRKREKQEFFENSAQ